MTAGERDVEALAEVLHRHIGWSGCAGSAWALTTEPHRRKWLSMAEDLLPWLRDHDAALVAQAKRDAVGPVRDAWDAYNDATTAIEDGKYLAAMQRLNDILRAALGEQP